MLKKIHVNVDRPLGSLHPEDKAIRYPINYGYVPGILAGDGEEQDVYILGVNHPVKEFDGERIAIIHRKNDVEEKWVAAPAGVRFSISEIQKQVAFMEQYFDISITLCT